MEWCYRGEGNCSLVVADPLRKLVYRLLKQNYTRKFNGHAVDTEAKIQALQEDMEQVVSYVRWVMQPLLSSDYVVVPELTTVDEEFIAQVVRETNSQRPSRRMKKPGDRVDLESRSALILPDFCFVPHTKDFQHNTMSVEIKPKKSFITSTSDFDLASPAHGVCKFCMHQHLKRQAGLWPKTSDYCPLDLFSGNKLRMRHALQSLIKTPQNNLKMWRDGKDIYSAETRHDLAETLYDWFNDPSLKKPRAVSTFLDLVIEILFMSVSPDDPQPHSDLTRSPTLQRCQSSSFSYSQNGHSVCRWLPEGSVLERVYAAQLLDDLDIMGIYPLYQELAHQMHQNPKLRSEWGFDGNFGQDWLLDSMTFLDLIPGSTQWAVQKVKRFLVSKTLQDCSIMVAILPLDVQSMDASANSCQHGNNMLVFDGHWYKVSVALIDLDPKPFDKIPNYYQQATAIMASFQDSALPITLNSSCLSTTGCVTAVTTSSVPSVKGQVQVL